MTDLTYNTIIESVKDVLLNNLTDPYTTAGGSSRDYWVHSFDSPLPNYKYPLIQIELLPSPSDIISIGTNFWEHNNVMINVWFRSKEGFKNTIDGSVLKDKKLVAYYISQIKKTLKDNQTTLQSQGIGGFKAFNIIPPTFQFSTESFAGALQVRYWWFER